MRTPARRVRAALAAALAAATLAGCGVRLDTPPPDVPVADAAEEARQDAARAAGELAALAQAAADATADDDRLATALTAVAQASAVHRDALGGVWEPWPGAGPDATAHPGPSPDPTTTVPPLGTTSPDAVLDALVAATTTAHGDAVAAPPGELGRLLGAVTVSRASLAAELASALGTEAEPVPDAPLPVPEPGTVDAETSRSLDAARYALEVVAARSSGDLRAAVVTRVDHLAAVAGAVAPEEDRRDAAYDLTGAEAGEGASEHALAAAAELDVVRAYVTLLASRADDRADVLAAAVDAAGRARSWGAPLPPLPGLS